MSKALEAVSRIGKPQILDDNHTVIGELIAFVEKDLERQQSMLEYANSVREKCPHPKLQDERIAEKQKEIEKTIALLKRARGED